MLVAEAGQPASTSRPDRWALLLDGEASLFHCKTPTGELGCQRLLEQRQASFFNILAGLALGQP